MYFVILVNCLVIYYVKSLTGIINPTQQQYQDQYNISDWNNSLYFTIESKYVPYSYQYSNISYYGVATYNIFSVQNGEIQSQSTKLIFLSYLKIDTIKQTLSHIFEIQTTLQKYTESFTLNNLNYEGQWYSLEIRNDAILKTLNITFYQNSNKNNIFNKIYKNECFPIDNNFSFFLGNSLISQNLQINQFQGPIKYQLISASTRFSPQTISCSSNSGYALRSSANFTQSTYYEYQTKDIIAKSYGIGTWIKINQSNIVATNYINVIHVQMNPNVNYLNFIGGRLANVIYTINSTKQMVQIIYQTYTFPIKQDFVKGIDPLEKSLTFEVSNLYSLYNWHYIGLSYRNNQIQLLISFPQINQQIMKTISNVYQFSDLNLVIHLGGTKFNLSNNNGTFGNPYFYSCLSTFTPICHYTCSSCFGPFLFQCLTCSISSNRQLSYSNKCLCKSGFLDINLTVCFQLSGRIDNYIPLSNKEGYDQEYPKVVCSYGYFKYDDQCFQCPKLNIRYFCPECIQYPNKWVNNPICTKNYSQYNLSENNTFSQDIQFSASQLLIVLDPYDVYTFNNLELSFCTYCNSLCLTAPYDSQCQKSNYYHLQQNVMVICFTVGQMVDYQCRYCPTQCTRCAYINYEYICLGMDEPFPVDPACVTNSQKYCDDCVDHIKYYLNLNQTKCFLCQIPNCKYCFEFHSQNVYENSIFNVQNLTYEQSDLVVGCALCYPGYIYNFKTGKCEQNINALYSVCVYYYITNTNKQICLVSSVSDFSLAVSVQNCYNFLANCFQCFQPSVNQYYCLQCDVGYYIQRPQGTCQSCNEYNNQYSECYQETYTLQNYKYEIIPQIFNLTQLYHVNSLQNTQPLAVTVTNCIPSYSIQSAVLCKQVDLQYCKYYNRGCQTCDQTLEGTKRLTILNLRCSDCPYYCEYCKPRYESEIYAINPFSNLTAYPANYLTYRCIMKSTNHQYSFFDNEQQLVRICTADVPKCQLEIQYNYSTFISILTFILQFSNNINSINYFNLKSVTGFSLFVNASATYIQPNSYLANYYYNNTFIQGVLSLKYTKISLNYNSNAFIFGTFFFRDFQYFSFSNMSLLFSITKNSTLNFISITDISFLLTDVVISDSYVVPSNYYQLFDQSTSIRSYKISIQNAKIVDLTNVIIQNISLTDTTFFDLKNSIELDYLQLMNVTFLNCSFKNTFIITLNTVDQYKTIQFFNIQFINCNFQQSYFFKSYEFIYKGYLKIQNLKIQNCTMTNSYFITFPICNIIQIFNLTIVNTTFQDSTLLTLSSSTKLEMIQISNTSIKNSQIIYKGKNSLTGFTETFEFNNLLFFDNLYTQSSFISIHQHGNESIKIFLSNINTSMLQLFPDTDWVSQQTDLFAFEGSEILITNLYMQRKPGARDFIIQNFDTVVLNTIFVTSDISEDDMQTKQTKISSLNTIFAINTYFLQIIKVNIENQLLMDTVLIIINNNDNKNSLCSVFIENLKVTKSKLIKTTFQYISTILQINSKSDQIIKIQNCNFSNIWLNEYIQDPEISSAVVVVIKSELGSVYFSQILLNNVIVTNSSNSIILVQSNVFEIDNITSSNINNIRLYSQEYNDKYYIPNEINSQGGLMHLQIQQFTLSNSEFTNSTGLQGGVFYIATKFNGIIQITNCKFINSSSSLINSNDGFGGCFYFDSGNSYLNLNINKNSFINTSSGNSGGVFYFKVTQHKSIIKMTNQNFIDSFSLRYPIIDFHYEVSNSILSSLIMKNITIHNNIKNFLIYLQNYQYKFIQFNGDSAMFSSSGCQIKIQNFSFTGYSIHKLFSFNYVKQLILEDITINQLSQLTQQLIYIQNNQSNMQILNLEIRSSLYLNNIKLIKNVNDELSVTDYNFYDFLKFFNEELEISLIGIIFNDNINSMTLQHIEIRSNNCSICNKGLISLINYQNQTKVKISNLLLFHNNCGQGPCLYLKSSDSYLIHEIQDSKFLSNVALQGGGLYCQNMRIFVKRSLFSRNIVQNDGGAILYENDKSELLMSQVYLISNSAQKGGAMLNLNIKNISNYYSAFFLENQATHYGNNIVTAPYKLQIELNKTQLSQYLKTINNSVIEVSGYKINQQFQQFIYLPSGINLNNYQRFSFELFTYLKHSDSLTLKACNFLNEHMHELNSSYCQLQTKQIEAYENGSKVENKTSNKSVVYDSELNLYDIGELIFVLDPYTNNSQYLEVDIACNSINRDNYYLRLFLKTLHCQIGEYYSDNQCLKCDFERGYYSVSYKSTQCKRIDIQKLRNTTGAMLELQTEYWRYNYRSDIIIECSKYPSRCLGGWNISDETCIQGAIGALCEECDLFNMRGQGSYLNQQKEECSICGQYSYQMLLSFFESLWVVILIFLTVRSTHFSNQQLFKLKCLYKNFNALYKSTIDQTSILIKMANNIFQILTISYTFQIQILDYLSTFVLFLGDSTYMTSYQIDCSIPKITAVNFEYAHFIILITLPFIHFSICCFIYMIMVAKRQTNFSKAYFYSAIIYLYCLNQQSIVKWGISLISRRQISDIDWIQANVASRFDTATHQIWLIRFIYPILIFYALLVPLFLFISLRNIKDCLDEKNSRLKYSFLYNEYNSHSYYWEIVKIVQKLLIILVAIYYEQMILIKGVIIFLIVLLYSQFCGEVQPYKVHSLNQIDVKTSLLSSLIIMLSLLLYIIQSSEQEMNYLNNLVQIIIVVVILRLLEVLLRRILIAYFKKLDLQFDSMRTSIKNRYPKISRIKCLKSILKLKKDQQQKVQARFGRLRQYLRSKQKSFKYRITISQKDISQIINPNDVLSQNTSKPLITCRSQNPKQSLE